MKNKIILTLLLIISTSLVSAQMCTDTDGGINKYIKGEVTSRYEGMSGIISDYCLDENTLLEKYCKDEPFDVKYVGERITCDFGCLGGRCLKESENNLMPKKITSDGTYTVMKEQRISLNGIEATILEISWALQGDTEPKIFVQASNAAICWLRTGESCNFWAGGVTRQLDSGITITVNKINTNEEQPQKSTASITVKKFGNTQVTVEEIQPRQPQNELDESFPSDNVPQNQENEQEVINQENNNDNTIESPNYQAEQTNTKVFNKIVSWFKSLFK